MMYFQFCGRPATAFAVLVLSACSSVPTGGDPAASPAPRPAGFDRLVNPKPSFSVKITGPEKQPVIQGETLAFRLVSQKDGFGQLYLFRASGDVQVLAENLPVKAGVQRVFPDSTDRFELKAERPPGMDTALLVVTAKAFTPEPGLAERPAKPLPAPSPLRRPAFIERLGGALDQLHPDEWSGARTSVDVLVRK